MYKSILLIFFNMVLKEIIQLILFIINFNKIKSINLNYSYDYIIIKLKYLHIYEIISK